MDIYHRLSCEEREELSRGLAQGESLRKIAARLNRQPSTLARELNRNGGNQYRAIMAQRKAVSRERLRQRECKLSQNPLLWSFVVSKLRKKWSPVQISQTLKREYPDEKTMQISHETIYSYLYVLPRGTLKSELLSCLRQARKHRLKRSKADRFFAPKITEMISIEERPAEVADRCIPGHWEGDIILGKQRRSFLGTLVERTTRTVLLVPLPNKKAPTVRAAFEQEVLRLPKTFRLTLTYDQGTEMAQHKLFTKKTKVQVYFAHLSSPWERGTNENTNGLIRQFFPKNTDFNTIPRKHVKQVQKLLNERPRKVLNWKTPKEALTELLR